MDVQIQSKEIEEIDSNPKAKTRLPREIIRSFNKAMNFIRSAESINDLYQIRSYRLKKLSGDRSHQLSLRLNDQWRLIIEIDNEGKVIIISIEDYH